MGAVVRRRLKAPVLGRLAWAWLAFALAGAGALGYALFAGDRFEGPTRVAFNLGSEIERFAPARPAAADPAEMDAPVTASVYDASRTAPGAERLRDGARALPDNAPRVDVFADIEPAPLEQPPLAEEGPQADDIIITIDGAPAANGADRTQATPVSTASLRRPAVAIPDPDAALLTQTPLGARPVVASDGRRAARYYARPFDSADRRPRAALIVGGLGLNADLTERAIAELPPEVTLAFAPYAKDLDYWTKRARDAGHEIMIELPMEGYGEGAATLGPAALLTERSEAENLQRLDWLLARFGAYFGVTNYRGGKFSSDRAAMDAVLARLADAGVAYVDDTGAARRYGSGAAPLAIVNRMVSTGADGGDAEAARRDLNALAAIAERSGDALGKAYAYHAAIDAAAEWAAGLEERGVVLAPASAVVHARDREL